MEEAPEVPLEQVSEDIHHNSHGQGGWVMGVALTTSLLAVLAAIASLLAGHYANEGVLEQLEASNRWSYYQSKSVKENLVRTKVELLEALGKVPSEKDREKLNDYKREQETIQNEAHQLGEESKHHMQLHSRLARSVTLFQVAIGVAAIAVLTRRKRFWLVGLAFGSGGVVLLVTAFL
jgi:hypothetical protein